MAAADILDLQKIESLTVARSNGRRCEKDRTTAFGNMQKYSWRSDVAEPTQWLPNLSQKTKPNFSFWDGKTKSKHSKLLTALWLGVVARPADSWKLCNLVGYTVFWRCSVIFVNTRPKHSKPFSEYCVIFCAPKINKIKNVNDLCFLKRFCWPQSNEKLFGFSVYTSYQAHRKRFCFSWKLRF